MQTTGTGPSQQTSSRLLSLDVMRGLIMILLAAESCAVYVSLNTLATGATGQEGAVTGHDSFAAAIVRQFFHHPWHGLRVWDLVQPAFMTMAGAALYLSYYAKTRKGISWADNFPHVALRCLKLFICGTALHCVYAGHLVWELWNVLTQLSITTLIAYLIIRRSAAFQIVVSVALLVLTEVLYRTILKPGFDQPFTEFVNFGAWFDTVLMGKINTDGWVAINFIPTAAHTIWGVLGGRLLISVNSHKIRTLIMAAAVCLLLGYSLDLFAITPVIKRISTSSFALVSGGWVLLALALLYWLVDVRKYNRYAWVFVVVGMNAIFIYLFFETVGVQWVNPTVAIFTNGLTGLLGMPAPWQALVASFTTWLLEWALCYWLYKKKIFFKL